MKIIEALKEIPLIEKKINSNCQLITQYASYCSKTGPSFKDKAEQEKELKSLIQSNVDLAKRQLGLKRILAKTNATLTMKINDLELTIVEWLEYKKKAGELMKKTYLALSLVNGSNQLGQYTNTNQRGLTAEMLENAMVERCFDEKAKNTAVAIFQDTLDKISGQLEIFNATTDLVESL